MRETSAIPIKTSVRNGRVDFLLRYQPKSQYKKWNQIPPVKITLKIPEFNVGIYKENINDKENRDEEIAKDLGNDNKRKRAVNNETEADEINEEVRSLNNKRILSKEEEHEVNKAQKVDYNELDITDKNDNMNYEESENGFHGFASGGVVPLQISK